MRSPDLANTLESLAAQGAQSPYSGELGRLIAEDMTANGGLLTWADLAEYRTVARTPLRVRLGAWDVAVNPAPSIGGPTLTAMLRLLAQRHADGTAGPGAIVDIQRRVLAFRHNRMDRAQDLERAGAELLDLVDRHGDIFLAAVSASPETIHVSAIDSDGLACSATTSAGYGSGVTIPGTGLMMNNALGEPELNRLGLHALTPGTRLASNMAPTAARRGDGAALAIGSPGADRITTALMQVLGHVCLDDMGLQAAIDAPRLHVAYDDDGRPRLEHEDGPGLREAAHDSGLPWRTHEEIGMYFGGVAAALRHANGTLLAAGDPRREAATGVV
jgi:gamma-glutamyltranspeptidase/glutathione hydrolase